MRYRSKPAEIEAIQWTGDNSSEVRAFIGNAHASMGGLEHIRDEHTGALWVAKSQQWCQVDMGAYVIREPDGSGVYPCAEDIFDGRWEPINKEDTDGQDG